MWQPSHMLSDYGIFPVKPLCPNWSAGKPENKEWHQPFFVCAGFKVVFMR
jgi:hypothetical protein